MTDLRKTTSSRRPALSTVWLGGLCWLSSLGIADLPTAAQTASDPIVPGAADLLQVDPPVPPSAAEDPVAPLPEPAAEAPSRSVDLELSTPGAPEQSAVEGSLGSSETSGSGVESSTPGQESNPAPLVSPNLATQAESAFGQSGSGFGNFIDSTPYSLGATDNPNVVLSERSTGCETTVQPGQTVASVCSSASQAYANSTGGGGSYSGDFGLSVVYGGRTVPSGRDFYNLTVRPPARLSLGNVGLLFPLTIPAAITSVFGWRIHPVLESSRFHSGTDLGAPQGTPVLAAFSGKVAVADFMGGYGLTVVLQHQNGSEETLYGHLSEIFVKPGETVKQGEVIGRVGSTGLSTGPHLHFEFRKQTPEGWVVMDPGGALEYALSQFVNALKLGLAYPPKLATIQASSFTKALEMVQARDEATNSTEPSAAPRSQADPVAGN